MQRSALAVTLALVAVSAGALPLALADGPSDCSTAAFQTVRSCRGLPGGGSGVYYDTPVCFVYGGTTRDGGASAGGGSLAGGNVRTGPGMAALVVYGNTVVAFDRVTVSGELLWDEGAAGLPGVLVSVPVRHWGMGGEHSTVSSVFVGDRNDDSQPDARVVLRGEEVKLLP